jgi:hypothetical protein
MNTGDHVQMPGMMRRGARVIWRKLYCLKPNLQRCKSSSTGNGV